MRLGKKSPLNNVQRFQIRRLRLKERLKVAEIVITLLFDGVEDDYSGSISLPVKKLIVSLQ